MGTVMGKIQRGAGAVTLGSHVQDLCAGEPKGELRRFVPDAQAIVRCSRMVSEKRSAGCVVTVISIACPWASR